MTTGIGPTPDSLEPGHDIWRERVEGGDWEAITRDINEYGGALLPQLLTAQEAESFRAMYPQDERFRSTIDMQRYRFGEGQYRYSLLKKARLGATPCH